MASFLYDLGRERFLGIASGSINWTNDTIKAVLLSSSYTPNQATDDFVANRIHAHTGSLTAQTLTGKSTNSNGSASKRKRTMAFALKRSVPFSSRSKGWVGCFTQSEYRLSYSSCSLD